MKSWHKISITLDPRMTDAVTAYLTELTGTGVEISAAENGRATTAHPFPTEKITAYIPIGLQGADKKAAAIKIEQLWQFLSKIRPLFADCPEPHLSTETIMEEDWSQKWKSFFTSFQITPTLTIKPSWEEAGKAGTEAGSAVIEMDPGLAFGTGHHASTQLALLLLEELFQNRPMKLEKVLDVGTGSGILAMACRLFGAKDVLALDNDPDALETAKQNILRNRLGGRVKASGQDVTTIQGDFDIIVANIIHDVLSELAIPLTSLLHRPGFLVLSGILQGDQEHSIRGMYTKKGLKFIKSLKKDEWVALQFQKK